MCSLDWHPIDIGGYRTSIINNGGSATKHRLWLTGTNVDCLSSLGLVHKAHRRALYMQMTNNNWHADVDNCYVQTIYLIYSDVFTYILRLSLKTLIFCTERLCFTVDELFKPEKKIRCADYWSGLALWPKHCLRQVIIFCYLHDLQVMSLYLVYLFIVTFYRLFSHQRNTLLVTLYWYSAFTPFTIRSGVKIQNI